MDDEFPLIPLSGPDGGSAADPLVEIVARYRQRRIRVLTAALVVAVMAGPALGFVLGRQSTPSVIAARPNATTPSTATIGGGSGFVASSSGSLPQATRLFVRTTADGVTMRAYLRSFSPHGVPVPAGCLAPQRLEVEVSDDLVASQTGGNSFVLPDPDPLTVLGRGPVGIEEGAPITTVSVRAAADVASVEAVFADGSTDEMAPVEGWAVLAHRVSDPGMAFSGGTLRALDRDGHVMGTVPMNPGQPAPECRITPPVPASGGVVMVPAQGPTTTSP